MIGDLVSRVTRSVAAATAAVVLVFGAGGVDPAGADSTEGAEGMTATVTSVEDGRTVSVAVGDTLAIRLHENATTGYRWEVETYDEDIVTLQDSSANYAEDAVGSGGQVTFRFDVKAPGKTEVHLKLWRSWEGEDSVVQRFTVTLLADA